MTKNAKAIAATTITKKAPAFKLSFYRNADRYGNGHVNLDGTVSLISDAFEQRESDNEWRS